MISVSRAQSARRQPRHARRGVSLIELLIVISIGTVVVGLCVTTMHLMLKVERDQARAVRLTMVLSRVRQLFSEDVHRGTLAEIGTGDGDDRSLRLEEGNMSRIVYSSDEHILRREEFDGERVEHRDEFHFPPGTEFHFSQESTPRIVRIGIQIAAAVPDDFSVTSRGKAQTGPPPRSVGIEARLDRDRSTTGEER